MKLLKVGTRRLGNRLPIDYAGTRRLEADLEAGQVVGVGFE